MDIDQAHDTTHLGDFEGVSAAVSACSSVSPAALSLVSGGVSSPSLYLLKAGLVSQTAKSETAMKTMFDNHN